MEKTNNLEVPIWSSCNNFAIEASSSNCSDQFPNFFLNPNWENPTDQNDPFESALSSIVSSPNANAIHSNTSDPIMIRELIGRLGSICHSPQSYINNSCNSTNTSCYTTPLNSPPKLNTLIADSQIRHVAPLPSDPGLVERAARFSCFGSKFMNGSINGAQQSGTCEKKMSMMSLAESADFGESREESSLSEQITGGDLSVRIQNTCTDSNPRKRKAIPRGRAKQSLSSSPAASTVKVAAEKDESSAKKGKSDEANGNDKAKAKEEESKNQKQSKDSSKPPEPPKDYIHVRARRGQATDSHSLAERVRREKISERMKLLQDLVPGCNKVTGKAVMLDEIINYVQSLQRQVEFLSLKLATVNPRLDFNVDALSKDVFQPRGPFPLHNIYPLDSSAALALPYHSQQAMPVSSTIGISSNAETQFPMNPLNAMLLQQQSQSMQLPPLDGFCDPVAHQVSAFWEDDIQSVVQLGFGQNQQHVFPIPDSLAGTQMKAEQ